MIFFYASWYVSWVLSSPTWRNMTYQLLQQTMRGKLIIGSYFQVSGLPRLPPAFSSMRFGKCFDINLILCTAAQPIQFVHVIHLQDRLQVFLEILQIKYCMLPNSLCIGIQINIPRSERSSTFGMKSWLWPLGVPNRTPRQRCRKSGTRPSYSASCLKGSNACPIRKINR